VVERQLSSERRRCVNPCHGRRRLVASRAVERRKKSDLRSESEYIIFVVILSFKKMRVINFFAITNRKQ